MVEAFLFSRIPPGWEVSAVFLVVHSQTSEESGGPLRESWTGVGRMKMQWGGMGRGEDGVVVSLCTRFAKLGGQCGCRRSGGRPHDKLILIKSRSPAWGEQYTASPATIHKLLLDIIRVDGDFLIGPAPAQCDHLRRLQPYFPIPSLEH